MENLKFRAFQDGQMLISPISSNYGLARFFGFLYEDSKVMQYTGLKDKNGVEICSGDILSDKWKVEIYQNDEGTFMVYFHNNPTVNAPRTLKKYLSQREKALTSDRDCIIIGNIYENKNLLE